MRYVILFFTCIVASCDLPVVTFFTDPDIVINQLDPVPATGGCDPCDEVIVDIRQYICAYVDMGVAPDTVLFWNKLTQGAPPISPDLLWPQGYYIYQNGQHLAVIAYDLDFDPYANQRIFTRDSFGARHSLVFSNRSANLGNAATPDEWVVFAEKHPGPMAVRLRSVISDSLQTDMIIEAFIEAGQDTCFMGGVLDIRGKQVAQCRKDQAVMANYTIIE